MAPKENLPMDELFCLCQDSIHRHAKLIPQLMTLFQNLPEDRFFRYFVNCLGPALTAPDRNVYAERILEFASNFVRNLPDNDITEKDEDSNDDPLNTFVSKLMNYLADCSNASDQVFRFRSCQLLNKLLHSNDSISDDLFEKLSKIMLERLQDKIAAVRVQACFALSRLQDPGNPDCPIIKAFLFHLCHDPNPDVRKAILSGIDASSRTLLPIVERTRDVKDSVRSTAYTYLGNRIHYKSLSISNRVRLLKEGLNDRTEIVKKTVTKTLLPAWIKQANGLVNFIQSLDVQGSLETTKLALHTHFESQNCTELKESFELLNEDKIIPYEKLTCVNVTYWCSLVQYLKQLNDDKADEYAESLLPELVDFIAYIKEFVLNVDGDWDVEKKLDHEFISQQLLTLCGEYEMSDLACQRFYDQLINDLLLSPVMGSGIIKPMVACYIKLHQGFENQLNGIAEIISNLREPITTVAIELMADERRSIEMDIARVKVKLNIERDQLAQYVLQQEFVLAQETKAEIKKLEERKEELENKLLPSSQEIRSEKNDPQTLLRCLTLITELLEQQNKSKMTAILQTIMETLLLPGIQNADPAVRNQAVLALGLCCMISKDAACQHFVLLIQINQIDQEVIQVTALKIICDLLLNYGLETFQDNEEKVDNAIQVIPETPPGRIFNKDETLDRNKFASNIIIILKAQLDSEFQDVRAAAAEGLGKLLLYNRIYSPNLLSRLIILWYNPVTEHDATLRHFLGVYLPYFASSGVTGQQCLEEAFLQTILTLMDAPRSSPLMQVDIINVGKFLLQLTSKTFATRKSTIQETSIHDRIAMAICNEIHKNPDLPCTRDWSKILVCTEISGQCHSSHKELLVLVEKILERVRDKPSLTSLRVFRNSLKLLVSTSQSSSQTEAEISDFSSPATSRPRLDIARSTEEDEEEDTS